MNETIQFSYNNKIAIYTIEVSVAHTHIYLFADK